MLEESIRKEMLGELGASSQEIEELLNYNKNTFSETSGFEGNLLEPLEDELFVAAWEDYVNESKSIGILQTLSKYFAQLNFPVNEGISLNANYKNATLKGKEVFDMPEATGISLHKPEVLQFYLFQTLAGKIPIIFTECREDFKTLVQVFSMKNEPKPIPDSMGACFIKGLNNWDRIHRYKKKWIESKDEGKLWDEQEWKAEFARLTTKKELYQDKLIILSDGPYSGITADEMGIEDFLWRRLSMIIRREHECTHYFSQRFYGSARNNILDEIIADYIGIGEALKEYNSEWLLKFLGLENYPIYRKGARLENYRGNPMLSDGAFLILQKLVWKVAHSLENFKLERGYMPELDREDIPELERGNIPEFNYKSNILRRLFSVTLEEMIY